VIARAGSTTDNLVLGQITFSATDGTGEAAVWMASGASSQVYLARATNLTFAADTYYTVRLQVNAGGQFFLWVFPQGGAPGEPILRGRDAALATGGARATGTVGIYDAHNSASACTRTYDNVLAFVPTADAAIFSQQSLTLAHDGATREDSGGTFSSKVSDRRGRYLKIPPAGPEGRSTRLAVLALPNDPYTMSDAAAIYDLSAQLFVTPRGLVVPEA
jgi:hypothetical protein